MPSFFFPDVMLGIQAKKCKCWFHQTRESCFSWSESPLGACWKTPSRLSCAFYCGVASVWPLYHKGLIGGWLSFWKVLPGTLELCQSDHRVLGHLPDQGPSPPIAQCASTQSCLGALRTIPSTSRLGFCSDMHWHLWDLI